MFKTAMLQETKTLNENGALAYTTTGDARVDYFSMVVRGSSNEDMIVPILNKAWAESPKYQNTQ